MQNNGIDLVVTTLVVGDFMGWLFLGITVASWMGKPEDSNDEYELWTPSSMDWREEFLFLTFVKFRIDSSPKK